MNKEIGELRKEVILLSEQFENQFQLISITESFIEKKGKYYTSRESFEALNKIITILAEKRKRLEIIGDDLEEKKNKFMNSCQHEVLVKDKCNNTFCTICGRDIFATSNSFLIITLPNGYTLQRILLWKYSLRQTRIETRLQEIIDEGIESDDMLEYVEEELEKLQFEEDIHIRRLRK